MTSEALRLPELPRIGVRRVLASRPARVAVALVGTAALGGVVLAAWRLATAAVADPHVLVPSSHLGFPSWMAGPLPAGQPLSVHAISVLLVVLSGLYLVVLACSRALPAWLALPAVVALTAIFALA